MRDAKLLGIVAGIPAGVIYFLLFGFHFWRSLAIGFFVASLYAVLAGIFLTVDKIATKLGVEPDSD